LNVIISKDKIGSDLVIFKYQSDSKNPIRYVKLNSDGVVHLVLAIT